MIYLNHEKVKLKKMYHVKEVFLSLWNFFAPWQTKEILHSQGYRNMKNNNCSANLKLPTGILSDLFQLEIVLFHCYLCSYIIIKSHLAGPSGTISKYLQVWQHSKRQMR